MCQVDKNKNNSTRPGQPTSKKICQQMAFITAVVLPYSLPPEPVHLVSLLSQSQGLWVWMGFGKLQKSCLPLDTLTAPHPNYWDPLMQVMEIPQEAKCDKRTLKPP